MNKKNFRLFDFCSEVPAYFTRNSTQLTTQNEERETDTACVFRAISNRVIHSYSGICSRPGSGRLTVVGAAFEPRGRRKRLVFRHQAVHNAARMHKKFGTGA